MSKFTEGPWAVVNGVIRANDGQSVASVHLPRMNDETMQDGESWLDMRTRTQPERAAIGAEMSANARLIAAAPELLSELRDLVEWLEANQRFIEVECLTEDLLEGPRAAIAKATA